MELKEAKDIAIKICYKLQPYCMDERINIAGSIRRMNPDVKDIEIICIAKKQEVKDLFGGISGEVKKFSFIHNVTSLGEVLKGSPMGRYMQILLPEGINLDLFMPEENDYYRQYAIRTGSADYSFKVIASAWKKKGWCGSNEGLRKMNECVETKGPDGKSKWKCVSKNPELPPAWNTEADFFKWLHIPLINPTERK